MKALNRYFKASLHTLHFNPLALDAIKSLSSSTGIDSFWMYAFKLGLTEVSPITWDIEKVNSWKENKVNFFEINGMKFYIHKCYFQESNSLLITYDVDTKTFRWSPV